ncbi:hypothetical protein BV22DRAFT_1052744, partial [Leucogyrophana mollusca]
MHSPSSQSSKGSQPSTKGKKSPKIAKNSSPARLTGRRHASSVSSISSCSSAVTPSLTLSSNIDYNADVAYTSETVLAMENMSVEDKILSMLGGSAKIARDEICKELGAQLPLRWIDGLTVAAQPTWDMTAEFATASCQASDIMVNSVEKEVAL